VASNNELPEIFRPMACSLPPDPSMSTRMVPQNYLRTGPARGIVFNTWGQVLTKKGRSAHIS